MANTVADLKVVLQPDVAGLEEAVVIVTVTNSAARFWCVTTVDIKEATSIPVLRTEQAQGRGQRSVYAELASPVPRRPSAFVDWDPSTTRTPCHRGRHSFGWH